MTLYSQQARELGGTEVASLDDRASAHVVPIDVPPDMRRTVHRTTLAGDVPVGLDGERSYALEGSSFQ